MRFTIILHKLNLPQPIVMGAPVQEGWSPRMIGYSLIVRSPKVTCFWDTILQSVCQWVVSVCVMCCCVFVVCLFVLWLLCKLVSWHQKEKDVTPFIRRLFRRSWYLKYRAIVQLQLQLSPVIKTFDNVTQASRFVLLYGAYFAWCAHSHICL